MKFYIALAGLFAVTAISFVMSMDKQSKATKCQFLVDHKGIIKEYALFAKKNKLHMDCCYKGRKFTDVMCLTKPSIDAYDYASRETAIYGMENALLTSLEKNRYITNFKTIIIPGEEEKCLFITMKPSPF